VGGTLTFTASVTAIDGALTLTATARDAAGNTAVGTRAVAVDSVAPVVTIASARRA
jgi:hypothetical protein